jgi:hypothetical protein
MRLRLGIATVLFATAVRSACAVIDAQHIVKFVAEALNDPVQVVISQYHFDIQACSLGFDLPHNMQISPRL